MSSFYDWARRKASIPAVKTSIAEFEAQARGYRRAALACGVMAALSTLDAVTGPWGRPLSAPFTPFLLLVSYLGGIWCSGVWRIESRYAKEGLKKIAAH